ncbi:unnamed protein product, partial [Ectocarpus fasciculatus]
MHITAQQPLRRIFVPASAANEPPRTPPYIVAARGGGALKRGYKERKKKMSTLYKAGLIPRVASRLLATRSSSSSNSNSQKARHVYCKSCDAIYLDPVQPTLVSRPLSLSLSPVKQTDTPLSPFQIPPPQSVST